MGATSFRTPQEHIESLDKYKSALDIISVIQEIVRSPDTDVKIKKITKELEASQEISVAKKQALLQAEETIGMAKKWTEDFAKEKAAHETEVNGHYEKIESQKTILKNETEAVSKREVEASQILEKLQKEAATKFAEAKKIAEDAAIRNQEADRHEKRLAAKEDLHQQCVIAFENEKRAHIAALDDAKSRHQEAVSKFETERKAFDTKKKKLNDALSE